MYNTIQSSYYPNDPNKTRDNTPSLSLIEDNNEPCMTLELLKEIARIDNDAEDNALNMFLLTAQDVFETHCSIPIRQKQYVQSQRWFNSTSREVVLRRWPVVTIDSIKYRDEAGVLQTIDPSNYELVGLEAKPSIIRPKISAGFEWPRTDGMDASVQITFTAGFERGDAIPQMYLKAIAELAHYYFDYRTPVIQGQSINELPDGILRILNRCRINYCSI